MAPPTGSSHASFTMAVLVAGGGIVGYLKAKSMPSVISLCAAISRPTHHTTQLIAGITFGAAFSVGGYLIAGDSPRLGHDVSAAASILLTGAMGARAAATKKMMPAGALAALGTLSAAYHINKSLEWRAT